MSNPPLELVLDAKATLGEGPCWDQRSGLLYWVDIKENAVHAYDPHQGTNRTVHLDQMVGAAVARESGGLVLALQHGFHLLDMTTEQLTFLADPEKELPDNRFNDGKCDAAGRFWAGTLSFEEKEPVAALYCLETDGTVRQALDGVIVSNGLGWSPDGRTMYYIDSMTRKVSAFDFEVETGRLSGRRTVVTIPEGGGFPDGMAVDEEGMLWVAQWDGWQVSRWNPSTGEQIGAIRVPAARVTSCAFGGPNNDELYITTARTGISEESLAGQPLAGGLFRVKPGVAGLPTYRYGG
ncbi:SMP-30/gluconolactonase/LRE family protein [Paenibacillus sp. H1-7]|uniref:SMP-30/gluconolactonase/LRE family protein n=1 Tax=Paenibacillus sp. H1-7 TaxID=2282849 RepID=UPI001EF93641|nr:SMP-30/gluconolactonase/LRE family protein [Paenibacillus sp. H1-7]ULL13208.1 SMP-30/gluconolactonase/LRE family protein [Paenibacillus sp. H1-7]